MSLPSLKKYHKGPYPAISPTLPQLVQSGKTVIVSGGSSGIGYAIARSFVAAGAARVIVLGRRQKVVESAATTLNKEAGRQAAEGRAVDAYSLPAIEALWSSLHAQGIYVHVLVLSAAAFGSKSPILANTVEDTWKDFEANVRAPLAMTVVFSNQKTGNERRFLVNISSIAAYMWSTMGPDRPTYGLTKNAGTALFQQIAKDTDPNNMQVVSFHPGGVLTESARTEGYAESGFDFDDENLSGNFAVWAASPEATFLHGRFVWANWDVLEMKDIIGPRVKEDEHFLKVGIEGLSEKNGGARF
ncbi:hypothetical protein MGG_09785 [Pyricularia oryzae 70-15]|uniref:Uncharacterized protein n=1 Tax=Pyricularia oryzae (strain 70-15 / ATCC MYA-4617 / FGSC 8958) TaxID=242507 RepID=G4N9Q1_PYRO7|nr:uncharacterized protein MGG_09785 [Pyricularia oryzae 70-15]EHA51239.1 hypothetical protein MGG_09785 [Pyricularia oryzae 70-15]KAI7913577.1 hypothetical protein M9X92_009363 [Pyricularia oryzae]